MIPKQLQDGTVLVAVLLIFNYGASDGCVRCENENFLRECV